jgi:6-phosphogluconolactonase
MITHAHVCVLPDHGAATREAAEHFARAVDTALAERSAAHIALSGGSTPRDLYVHLATTDYRERIPWARVHLYLTDERVVPVSSPESNIGMIEATLTTRVPIPRQNVHMFSVGSPDVQGIARLYEGVLRHHLGDPPRFDLVLLGLGEDTHTASLFPGSSALRPSPRLALPVVAMHLATRQRLTLTPRAINAAHAVVFLVTGAAKAEAVRIVLEGAVDPLLHPAQIVRPTAGTLTFVLDESSARMLTQ